MSYNTLFESLVQIPFEKSTVIPVLSSLIHVQPKRFEFQRLNLKLTDKSRARGYVDFLDHEQGSLYMSNRAKFQVATNLGSKTANLNASPVGLDKIVLAFDPFNLQEVSGLVFETSTSDKKYMVLPELNKQTGENEYIFHGNPDYEGFKVLALAGIPSEAKGTIKAVQELKNIEETIKLIERMGLPPTINKRLFVVFTKEQYQLTGQTNILTGPIKSICPRPTQN